MRIVLRGSKSSFEVEFCIDTRIGIENDVLENSFKPFSQVYAPTARIYGVTGLGLTISKNVSPSFLLPRDTHISEQLLIDDCVSSLQA